MTDVWHFWHFKRWEKKKRKKKKISCWLPCNTFEISPTLAPSWSNAERSFFLEVATKSILEINKLAIITQIHCNVDKPPSNRLERYSASRSIFVSSSFEMPKMSNVSQKLSKSQLHLHLLPLEFLFGYHFLQHWPCCYTLQTIPVICQSSHSHSLRICEVTAAHIWLDLNRISRKTNIR